MNKPTVNKGDIITLPATPGDAMVNPSMWPTGYGYRIHYGESARHYLPQGVPVTVVDVRDDEIMVRHYPSKSTVLLSPDDLTNPVLNGFSGEPYYCSVCTCPFSIDEWYDRHDEGDMEMHADCCLRSGPCAETGAYAHEDS